MATFEHHTGQRGANRCFEEGQADVYTPHVRRTGARLQQKKPSRRGSSRALSNSSCLTALIKDRSARSASGAAMGRTRPGMIANFINRTFGRDSLRGVARVRHVALTADTGSKQYAAGHSSSTGMRAVKNAWDSTSDRAQGGFTSPA